MGRKSKDPRKPSQAYLAATGQSKQSQDQAASPAVAQGSSEQEDVLRREIKALGGDDEDWEMLKNLSDGEEVEVEKKTAVPADEVSFKAKSYSFLSDNDPNELCLYLNRKNSKTNCRRFSKAWILLQ